MISKLRTAIPLLFLAVGLIFLLWGEREFQRRADRDNTELREDLRAAGVSNLEYAALLAAQTKSQANTSSFIESSTLVIFILMISSIIPLYSQVGVVARITARLTGKPMA